MKKALMFILAAAALQAQTANNLVLKSLGEGDLPTIKTQKGFSTLIEFPPDHKILEVTCGDKDDWVIEGSGRFLHVKPAKENIVTNLNIVAEGDLVYAFILREISKPGGVKENADLQVTINPGEDPAKVSERLTASLQESEELRQKLAQSEQALADLNAKYQAEKEKNEKPAQPVSSLPTTRPSPSSTRFAPPGWNRFGPGR